MPKILFLLKFIFTFRSIYRTLFFRIHFHAILCQLRSLNSYSNSCLLAIFTFFLYVVIYKTAANQIKLKKIDFENEYQVEEGDKLSLRDSTKMCQFILLIFKEFYVADKHNMTKQTVPDTPVLIFQHTAKEICDSVKKKMWSDLLANENSYVFFYYNKVQKVTSYLIVYVGRLQFAILSSRRYSTFVVQRHDAVIGWL